MCLENQVIDLSKAAGESTSQHQDETVKYTIIISKQETENQGFQKQGILQELGSHGTQQLELPSLLGTENDDKLEDSELQLALQMSLLKQTKWRTMIQLKMEIRNNNT